MNTATTINQSQSSVNSLNKHFNAMMHRFNTNKPALQRVADELSSFDRENLLKQLQLEATNIQHVFTTHVLHQSSFKYFDFYVTVMWHLASQLKALLDTEKSSSSLFYEATTMAEKQAIVNFFLFIKTVDVMQPVELQPLRLTAALTNNRYANFVTLID